jgi:hypothetical protein
VSTQTSEGDGGKDEPPRPPTRLEREVAEIIERSERQPISLVDEARRRANASRAPARSPKPSATTLSDWFDRLGPGRYLILAVVAAVLALLVSDFSPLLANLLAIVCVAAIFIPVVQRFRQPDSPGTKTWRGQDLSRPPSPPAGLERIFDRFRRPPRI